MSENHNKKIKKPKHWTLSTSKRGSSPNRAPTNQEPPIQAKDSTWVGECSPLALLFPGVESCTGGRALSTTEVTRRLVDLHHKPDLKPADRLIPPDKKWLQSVPELPSPRSGSTAPLPEPSTSAASHERTLTGTGEVSTTTLVPVPDEHWRQ